MDVVLLVVDGSLVVGVVDEVVIELVVGSDMVEIIYFCRSLNLFEILIILEHHHSTSK